MQQSVPSAIFINFLGKAPRWYKYTIIAFLIINPLLFQLNPYLSGWVLVIEFIFTLAMALKCYPLQPGGLLAIEALLIGMTSTMQVEHEIAQNLDVLLLLIFMVAGFILVDTSRILHFFRTLIPEVHQGRYRNLVACLDTGPNGVVRGQLLICLVNGIFTLVGLVIIGVPFAFTLALVAMVCSLIPIFGTIISSIPVVIMGVTVSFGTGLLALGWILLIHFIEANFLNPKIMGTAAQIHPALIVFALVTGEYMAGIAGALLAVPIFSILQTLFLSLKALAEELEPKRFQDVPREVAGD